MMTVAMLIRPMSSHLAIIDADIDVIAIVAVAVMTLNVTTVGGTIEGGWSICRHCSI